MNSHILVMIIPLIAEVIGFMENASNSIDSSTYGILN